MHTAYSLSDTLEHDREKTLALNDHKSRIEKEHTEPQKISKAKVNPVNKTEENKGSFVTTADRKIKINTDPSKDKLLLRVGGLKIEFEFCEALKQQISYYLLFRV